MSSIDRYRPLREGYQPPSLPPKPQVAAIDRLSKSPSRRRDVPPAVPSPPTHSSRTSPPRPLSRRSAPSPARSSPLQAPQPLPDQWFFTADEVLSTPSIVEGLLPSEERLRRAKGVNFIYQAGILLDLPQITLWVAGVFFHRFYMRYSMMEEKGGIHHYNIAATALFLANKTEENCRKTKDVIIAVAKVAQKNTKLIIDEQSKEYWKWRDSILTYEELMLEALTFDLTVDNPYMRLYEYFGRLDLLHNKRLRDSTWAFCNDACLTVLPLMLNARDIAIAAIFFATAVTGEKIDDVNGQAWWQYLRGSETHTVRAVQFMTDFYKENPLRKQDNNKVPGSPVFNLESTRRRGELSLSQMDLDSSQYGTPTPLGTDRGGTQSPPRPSGGARQNGKAERESSVAIKKEDLGESSAPTTKVGDEPSASGEELASQTSARGDSDAALKAAANDLSTHDTHSSTLNGSTGGGLVSPRIKRRSEEPEDGEERESKRQKLGDEDGGEIKGS
ncbi:cyclin-like protein [Parathielavia appendiculata]|uniref:RNA polymerase II holoenzyme cyclin-like subunit n=1 Tax=Parathielavia appendiculata TaxID=2587402 RepID=A0AAN6U926_9PEZI|nr:cyclin-like protein [Parathielavia appendiculata]